MNFDVNSYMLFIDQNQMVYMKMVYDIIHEINGVISANWMIN